MNEPGNTNDTVHQIFALIKERDELKGAAMALLAHAPGDWVSTSKEAWAAWLALEAAVGITPSKLAEVETSGRKWLERMRREGDYHGDT